MIKKQTFETALESSGIVTRPSGSGEGAEPLGVYRFVFPFHYTEKSLQQPSQANWVQCGTAGCAECIDTPPLYKETIRDFSRETFFEAKNALSNATKDFARRFSDGSLNSLVDVPVCKETISTENIDLNNLCQSQDVVQTEEINSYSYMNSIDFPKNLFSLDSEDSDQNKQNKQFEACPDGGVPFPETEVNLVLYPQATEPTVLHAVNFFWRDAK